MQGEAEPPFVGDDSTTWLPFAVAQLALEREITRRIHTWFETGAGMTAETAVVRIAGNDVAKWGQPVAHAALGVAVGWE